MHVEYLTVFTMVGVRCIGPSMWKSCFFDRSLWTIKRTSRVKMKQFWVLQKTSQIYLFSFHLIITATNHTSCAVSNFTAWLVKCGGGSGGRVCSFNLVSITSVNQKDMKGMKEINSLLPPNGSLNGVTSILHWTLTHPCIQLLYLVLCTKCW